MMLEYSIEQLEEWVNSVDAPLLPSVVKRPNIFERLLDFVEPYIGHTTQGETLDRDDLWDGLTYLGDGGGGNVHETCVRVSASMLSSGVPADEVVQTIIDELANRIPEASSWNWNAEVSSIKTMCTAWMAKNLDVYQLQENPPDWVKNSSRIKSALRMQGMEPHGPGNGSLVPPKKLNGSTHHPHHENEPVASVGDLAPIDLWAFREPPTLPQGVLPSAIDTFAREKSRQTGLDINGLAMGALVACAAVIPNSIKLQPDRDNEKFVQPPILWTLFLGGVGVAKTGILNETMYAIRGIQKDLSKKYREEMAEWSNLDRDEKREAEKPKHTCLSLSDVTIEKLGEIAEASPDGLIIENDELVGWFGGMEKYSKGGGAGLDRKTWLQFNDCGTLSVERMGRSVYADPFGGCVIGGMQPKVIRALAETGTNDGLLQRFLPLALHKRVLGIPGPVSAETKGFDALVKHLYAMPRQAYGSLSFTKKAFEQWQRIDARVMQLSEMYQHQNDALASHLNKYGAMIARTALVFHCIEYGHDASRNDVGVEVLLRAEKLFFEFLLDHARAVYFDTLNQADSADILLRVADHLLSHPKVKEVSLREIQRGTKTLRNMTRRDADAIFDHLFSYGWLTGNVVKKSGSPATWFVNPQIHDGRFAKRAGEVTVINKNYAEEINRGKLRKAESSHVTS
jgi:hypothetical protein